LLHHLPRSPRRGGVYPRQRELRERGLYLELNAYRCHVFLDFREVGDDGERCYSELAAELNGRGVPDIDEALREKTLRPVREPYRALVNAATFRALAARLRSPGGKSASASTRWRRSCASSAAAKELAGGDGDELAVTRRVREELALLPRLSRC